MSEKIPPVVEVVWDDHTFSYSTEEAKLTPSRTVGYLVEETEDHITVAMSIQDGKLAERMFIDKRMFTRKRVIRRGG